MRIHKNPVYQLRKKNLNKTQVINLKFKKDAYSRKPGLPVT